MQSQGAIAWACARLWAATIVLAFLTGAAAADEWSFKQQVGAFGDPVSIAVVMSDDMQYAFLLRCEGRSQPMYAMLVTSELYRAPIANAELLVQVDDGEVYARRALVDGAPTTMRVTALLASLLFIDLARAQRRIAVAVRVGGHIRHGRDYPVAGLAEAFGSLKTACGF